MPTKPDPYVGKRMYAHTGPHLGQWLTVLRYAPAPTGFYTRGPCYVIGTEHGVEYEADFSGVRREIDRQELARVDKE